MLSRHKSISLAEQPISDSSEPSSRNRQLYRNCMGRSLLQCIPDSKDLERNTKTRKMGGLSLPDVVRELVKDHTVLRWCSSDFMYEVVDGQKFESRLVELLFK